LKAPFSGIVVSGDLSQSLGAPVEKGEQLFVIAPLGNYRVALNVDDHDVSKLQIGQTGSLRLVGLPYDPLPITISRITPVASAKDGGNYFRVEATLADMNDTRLRPGMQGIAKVQVGEESILWVWTHTVIERLRLWLWSIGL
jgi:multidrug efflux pump subunit AcrA (membrane-fusion protein)